MSELLSSITGARSSLFRTDGIVVETLAAAQTGSLLSVPSVTDKIYRIFAMATNNTSPQSGISLIVDGVTIESEKTLSDTTPSTTAVEFAVARDYASGNVGAFLGTYSVIECESFELIKNAGNTAVAIEVSYEVGEYK